MALAVRLGVAPRVLWGWSAATSYEYDEQGRVARSRVEPEWDREQYALVAALADIEAEECPSCGNPMSECMSAASDPDNPDHTHVYEAGLPHRCYATTAREKQAKKTVTPETVAPSALRYPVSRVEHIHPIRRRKMKEAPGGR